MSPSIYGSLAVPSNSTHTLQLSYPSEEWKLSLQEVKLLYLQRQYKQCAVKSTKLLRKADNQLYAIHKAFLHYYSAISYESLGRSAHNYSSNKLPLLNLARDNFTACKSSLAVALSGPVEKKKHRPQQPRRIPSNRWRDHVLMNEKRKTYPATSPTKLRCDTPILVEASVSHHAALSPVPAQQSATSSPTSTSPRQGQSEKKGLVPSPLRIHKVCHDGYFQDQFVEYDPSPLPPPTRPLPELPPEANHRLLPSVPRANTTHEPNTATIVPLFRSLAPQFYRHSTGYSTTSLLVASSGRTGRNGTIHQSQAYTQAMLPLPQNSPLIPLITSLSAQLDVNVKSINTLISKSLDLQRIHNAKKNSRLASFWSFTPTYDDENVIANDPFSDRSNYNDDNDACYCDYYHHNNSDSRNASVSGDPATAAINRHPTRTRLQKHNGNFPSTTTTRNSISPPSSSSSSSTSSSSRAASTDETRQQRIARLKADGWMTRSFMGMRMGGCGGERKTAAGADDDDEEEGEEDKDAGGLDPVCIMIYIT
ncbi:conserved hypothetical protein [Histoplasma capsulatum H143]|uniref:Uncharacterized protein n=1 Tax=Ajellomyces capsulatus (strain H143) TaxID=544712 RepID=C6H9Z6_AJECH|nr:conserved hypothetical protein [Histoplasma capsulatum H143]